MESQLYVYHAFVTYSLLMFKDVAISYVKMEICRSFYTNEDLTLVWMVELENGHSVLVKKQFMKMLCMVLLIMKA